MSQENEGMGFYKGVLIGGVIGAVVSLLFAPKSGRELRTDIGRKSKELYDDAKGFIAKGREKLSEIGHETDGRLQSVKAHAREAMEAGTKDEAAR